MNNSTLQKDLSDIEVLRSKLELLKASSFFNESSEAPDQYPVMEEDPPLFQKKYKDNLGKVSSSNTHGETSYNKILVAVLEENMSLKAELKDIKTSQSCTSVKCGETKRILRTENSTLKNQLSLLEGQKSDASSLKKVLDRIESKISNMNNVITKHNEMNISRINTLSDELKIPSLSNSSPVFLFNQDFDKSKPTYASMASRFIAEQSSPPKSNSDEFQMLIDGSVDYLQDYIDNSPDTDEEFRVLKVGNKKLKSLTKESCKMVTLNNDLEVNSYLDESACISIAGLDLLKSLKHVELKNTSYHLIRFGENIIHCSGYVEINICLTKKKSSSFDTWIFISPEVNDLLFCRVDWKRLKS